MAHFDTLNPQTQAPNRNFLQINAFEPFQKTRAPRVAGAGQVGRTALHISCQHIQSGNARTKIARWPISQQDAGGAQLLQRETTLEGQGARKGKKRWQRRQRRKRKIQIHKLQEQERKRRKGRKEGETSGGSSVREPGKCPSLGLEAALTSNSTVNGQSAETAVTPIGTAAEQQSDGSSGASATYQATPIPQTITTVTKLTCRKCQAQFPSNYLLRLHLLQRHAIMPHELKRDFQRTLEGDLKLLRHHFGQTIERPVIPALFLNPLRHYRRKVGKIL